MRSGSFKIITCFLSWSLCSLAMAQEKLPPIANKHFIPNAVQVQITPRGQKYFESNLQTILGNLGYSFTEGYFPEQKIVAKTPLNLKELEKTHPEGMKVYYMVRDLLTKWLVGFSVASHRPALEIGESGYSASFTRFALVTDEALLRQLGRREGAVMAIELEITRLTVATQAVKAWDMNNLPFVKVGVEDPSLNAGSSTSPIKIRLPFYIRINAEGAVEFEALNIEENFSEIPLVLKYKKLIVPKIALEVDGHRYEMNTAQLQATLDEQLPRALVEVRRYLSEFATRQLPEILNQKVKENLTGALEQIQDMVPPGQEPGDPRAPFKWGLKLTRFQLQNSLNIALAAYAEDPLSPNIRLLPGTASRGLPELKDLPADQYDLGMTVDRGLINRLLQLSFLRKNFEKISQGDGTSLKLTAPPLIDFVKPPAATRDEEAYLKLRISAEFEPNKPLWLDKRIVLSFDLIAKIRKSTKAPRGMELALQLIDTDSLSMDSKYLTLAGKIAEGLGSQVTKGIKAELKKRSQGWIKNDETIPGNLDLPPEVLGMKLDIKKVCMDPRGHLVMYLTYSSSKRIFGVTK